MYIVETELICIITFTLVSNLAAWVITTSALSAGLGLWLCENATLFPILTV